MESWQNILHDVAKQNYFIHVSSNVLHLHALAQHGKNVQICMAVDAFSYVGLLQSSILPDGIEQPIYCACITHTAERTYAELREKLCNFKFFIECSICTHIPTECYSH